MKRLVLTIVVLACIVFAQAQGTSQFTVNLNGASQAPPNASTATGSGTLTLNGQTLSYNFGGFWTFPVTTGSINGPTNSSSIAPILFDLGAPSFAVPNPPDQGGYAFTGTISSLTGGQINDLLAGLWYVNILSSQFPDGEIRGQITVVPEPATLGLLSIGGAVLVVKGFGRRKGSMAVVAATLCLVASISEATAQGTIDSTTTTRPITVAPGGAPSGEFVAPWVDVSPTMPYVDGLPVVQEPPPPPLPGASGESGVSVVPEPSTIVLLCVGAGLLVFRLRQARPQ